MFFSWDWDENQLLVKKKIEYLASFIWKLHIQIREDWDETEYDWSKQDETIQKHFIRDEKISYET